MALIRPPIAAALAPTGLTSLAIGRPPEEPPLQPGAESRSTLTDGEVAGDVLSRTLQRSRSRILIMHGLVVLESALRVLQPLMLAWAINGLLARSSVGLAALILVHLAFTLAGSVRQTYRSRVLGQLTSDYAARLLEDEGVRKNQASIARGLAQSRQQLALLDESIPRLVQVTVTLGGALVILGWYDLALVPVCLVLLIPMILLNAAYGRKAALVSGRLSAECRREQHVLCAGESREIRRHLDALNRWRGELADAEASHFCLMELFVVGVMATALAHFCLTVSPRPGDILAVAGYVLLFVGGLRQVPRVVQSLTLHRSRGGV